MNKRLFLLFSVFCMILFIAGCSRSAKESGHDIRIAEDADRIHAEINDHVTIDADVEIPENLKSFRMKKVKAHRPKVDKKTMKKFFFQDGDIAETNIDADYKCREFGKYDETNYIGKNEELLSVSVADTYYNTYDMEYIRNCVFMDPQFEDYNLDKYSLTDELPFASRDKVFKKIKKVYKALGVPISDEYEAYALDHRIMKKEEKPYDSEGNVIEENKKDSWTEEDDAYYFVFHQDVDGEPIRQLQYGDGYTGTGIEQTELNAVYGKNGWLEFSEEWAYELEETEEETEFLSASEAVKAFQKKCDMLITEEIWKIDEVELQLVPVFIKDNEYEIHPVWSFCGISTNKDEKEFDMEVLIDAITGKEIVLS